MGKILIILAIVLLLAGGGYYYYETSMKKPAETSTETTKESVSPTEEPSPTEAPKDAFTIEIQNGSGIEGEAGKAQKLLEGADFKVDKTANADNYDYDETVIKAGSDVESTWIDQLRETLGKNYTVKSGVTKLSSADSDSDVVVIIGSLDDSGKSMAPTVGPTSKPTPTTEATDTTGTPTPSLSPTP